MLDKFLLQLLLVLSGRSAMSVVPKVNSLMKSKGLLAIAKLKPLSLFISLLSMPKKAFDNVKIEK